jgi:hypothetical protein
VGDVVTLTVDTLRGYISVDVNGVGVDLPGAWEGVAGPAAESLVPAVALGPCSTEGAPALQLAWCRWVWHTPHPVYGV